MEIKEKMLESRFGIEIEMTGITRSEAATIVAKTTLSESPILSPYPF